MIQPSQDGISHVNIYSKGKTELGRFLSNFAYCPIQTEDGLFVSIEGYWGWLSLSEDNPVRESLRKAYGFQAKNIKNVAFKNGDPGRFDDRFEEKIAKAIDAKIKSDKGIDVLKRNRHLLELPLEHYYYYGDENNAKVIDVKRKYHFLIDATKTSIAEVMSSLSNTMEPEEDLMVK